MTIKTINTISVFHSDIHIKLIFIFFIPKIKIDIKIKKNPKDDVVDLQHVFISFSNSLVGGLYSRNKLCMFGCGKKKITVLL